MTWAAIPLPIACGSVSDRSMHQPQSPAHTAAGNQKHQRHWTRPHDKASNPTAAKARMVKAVANTKRLWDIIFRPGRRKRFTMSGTFKDQLSAKKPRPTQKRLRERCRRPQKARGATNSVVSNPA